MSSEVNSVLVVGAGPSGMTAAAELARRGIDVEIVDKRPGPTELSKATILWPRAIEVLADIDGHDSIRSVCPAQHRMAYFDGSSLVASISIGGDLRPAVAPQNIVEAQLADKLSQLNSDVLWNTVASEMTAHRDHVDAVLTGPDGVARARRYRYVVAADGAWSSCREVVGALFEGGLHEMIFVVADLEMSGNLDERTTYYWCSPRGIVVMTCLSEGVWRIFTAVPPGTKPEDITMDLVRDLIRAKVPLAVTIGEPKWISPFRVHARRIDSMRHGRFLFIGDAAHIHSPAGGQGVNLGILDAHSLGWRLSMVLSGHGRESLLDEFAEERMRAANAAVRQATLQTRVWMIQSGVARRIRNTVLRGLSKVRGFHLWYVPWLTGYRTMYSRWSSSGSVFSRLVPRFTPLPKFPDLAAVRAVFSPDRKPMLGETVGYSTNETGADIRKRWVADDGYTVLVRDAVLEDRDMVRIRRFARVRTVPSDTWGILGGRNHSTRRVRVLVVSPDGYIRYAGDQGGALSYLQRRYVEPPRLESVVATEFKLDEKAN